jgi:hypothetical protein
VPDLNKLCSISWSYDWQNWNAPPNPRIIASSGTDAATLRAMETVATKFGLATGGRDLDLTKPENAVLRWHKGQWQYDEWLRHHA